MADPATLSAAIELQPMWLKIWLAFLVTANLGAVLFVAKRTAAGWRPRFEAIAIIAAFLLAGEFMDHLYAEHGYVRLLGLAHVVFWTPVYVWIFTRHRRKMYADTPIFAKFVVFYLVIAGISLVIDYIDVARYLLGETASIL